MLGSLQVAALALTCAAWVACPAAFVVSRLSRDNWLRRSMPVFAWLALQVILTGALAGQYGPLAHVRPAARLDSAQIAIACAAAGLLIITAGLMRQRARPAAAPPRRRSGPPPRRPGPPPRRPGPPRRPDQAPPLYPTAPRHRR